MIEFLQNLWRSGDFAYFFTLPARRATWFETNNIPDVPQGQNVYFSVNPLSVARGEYERATAQDVQAVNAIFADFDGYPESLYRVNALDIYPSAIVYTGGGIHAYWTLSQPFVIRDRFDLDRVTSVQARWVDFVGADTAAKAITQTLRLPGSVNYKPGRNKAIVEILHYDDENTYSLADIAAMLPKAQPRVIKPVTSTRADVRRAKDYLSRIAGYDDYKTWYTVGMALQALGNDGLALWEQWSAQSGKNKQDDCIKKWQSFKGHGRTLGTLHHLANGGAV